MHELAELGKHKQKQNNWKHMIIMLKNLRYKLTSMLMALFKGKSLLLL